MPEFTMNCPNCNGELIVTAMLFLTLFAGFGLLYVATVLQSMINHIKSEANGLIPGISRDVILELLIPIPPATLVNGSPRAKARPGDTFPELPAKTASEPEGAIAAEDIAALRKAMKLTQVKFAELFGVTARKVSEWEHGKSIPNEEILAQMRKLKKLKSSYIA